MTAAQAGVRQRAYDRNNQSSMLVIFDRNLYVNYSRDDQLYVAR